MRPVTWESFGRIHPFAPIEQAAGYMADPSGMCVDAAMEGQPAELGVGVHVPFGPMISIAGVLHFLWLHRWVDVLVEQARYVFLFQP